MYRKTPVPDWTVADEERERQLEMKEEQRYGQSILERTVPRQETSRAVAQFGSPLRRVTQGNFPTKIYPKHLLELGPG